MITALLSVTLYPILWTIALLPFRALYWLSDFGYFVGYKLFKYRKNLVHRNMQLTFPDKTSEEIDRLAKEFYRNFFDIIVETIKMRRLKDNAVLGMMIAGKMQILDQLYKDKKSVVLASSHFGNWELGAAAYALRYPGTLKGVYMPLRNSFFNQFMIKLRTRFGGELYTIDETFDKIRKNIGQQMAIGLLSDQSPSSHQAHWHAFLNRATPVHTGMEILSKRFDFPVVYLRFDRLGRGKYQMNAELITEKPQEGEKYFITHSYISKLERDVLDRPTNWLWTHNRWKRKKLVPENQPVI